MNNLQSFKKANKQARLRMAQKSGYTSVEAYLNFLVNGTNAAPNVSSPVKRGNKRRGGKVNVEVKTAHSVHILDCSGSMGGGKLMNALKGINSENNELKLIADINWKGYLVNFSGWNDIQTSYWGVGVGNLADVYFNSRDMTALNDAVGTTLERLIREIPIGETAIVKIFTDGMENNSRKYDNKAIKELVRVAEARGIIVSYQGASKAEVDNAIRNYGIDETNTFLYENSAAGVAGASATRGASMNLFSKKLRKGEDVKVGFYKTIKK